MKILAILSLLFVVAVADADDFYIKFHSKPTCMTIAFVVVPCSDVLAVKQLVNASVYDGDNEILQATIEFNKNASVSTIKNTFRHRAWQTKYPVVVPNESEITINTRQKLP